MYTCEYCKKSWSRRYNMAKHQKTAKYCLEIQSKSSKSLSNTKKQHKKKFTRSQPISTKSNQMNITPPDIVCGYCKAEFRGKYAHTSHTKHQLKCVVKELERNRKIYEEKISNLLEIIKTKDEQIERFAMAAIKRPTNKTIINQKIQNLVPINISEMQQQAQYLTIDHIKKGALGYAQFALEYPLKDRVVCVDYARRKVKFKNDDGELISDPDMANTAMKFFESIKDQNEELIVQYSEELSKNFGENGELMVQLLNYKTNVESGASGQKNEFHTNFVKECCSLTTL